MKMDRKAILALGLLLISAFIPPISHASEELELLTMQDAVVAAGGDWAAIEEFLLSLSPEDREKVIETYPERIEELREVQRSIEESGANWTAVLNPIALLPPEERGKLLGSISEVSNEDTTRVSELQIEPPSGAFPTSFDWRNYGGLDYTTSVKNQRVPYNCGSCWAFALCGAVESRMKISAGNPNLQPDLSEQEILSCSPGTCVGWKLSLASDWLINHGTVDESCYPYLAVDTKPCHDSCQDRESRRYFISDWCWVGSDTNINNVPPDAIAQEIMCCGPVGTYMEAWSDFWYYGGGVYKKSQTATKPANPGHSVVIVGWGYDPTDGWYWICKNSWGTSWGESGWFKIKMGEVFIEDETIAHQPMRAKKVLFYEGHGAPFPLSTSYKEWGNRLAGNGYLVHSKTTSPLTSSLLQNYDIVIISNPSTSFSKSELDSIKEFVGRGRVIASGDGNLFDNSYIYKQDNERMAVEYIDWLAKGEGGGIFIMGENSAFSSNAVPNQIANMFGLKINSNVITDPKRYDTHSSWPILGPKDDVVVPLSSSVDISKDAFALARATSSGYTHVPVGLPTTNMSSDWDLSSELRINDTLLLDATTEPDNILTTSEIETSVIRTLSDSETAFGDLEIAPEDMYSAGKLSSEAEPASPSALAEGEIEISTSIIPLAGLSFTGPIGIAAVDFGRKGEDTAGIFRPSTGAWYLDYDKDRVADEVFIWGLSTDIPLAGDWDEDGKDTSGLYRPSTGAWYLDYNNDRIVDKILTLGLSTDLPLVGDWNGDGKDTIGLYRPSTGAWYLDYDNNGAVDKIFIWGLSTDMPVVGDWNGDGKDSAGLYRPSTGTWYLDDHNDQIADQILTWGLSTDKPVVGDWNGDGKDTIGLYRPSTGAWYLDYDNNRVSDEILVWGLNTDKAVVGDWYKKS